MVKGDKDRQSWCINISIFNRLFINVLCLKSNWFDLKLKILNFDWRQEIILIVVIVTLFHVAHSKYYFAKYLSFCCLF